MFWNKLYRTFRMLGDKSEVFDDRPFYRWEVIAHIWNS